MLEVILLTPQRILFQGRAHRVIFPGEHGTFEISPFHKPVMGRLAPGCLVVDDQAFVILRGVAKVAGNRVVSIVETEPRS